MLSQKLLCLRLPALRVGVISRQGRLSVDNLPVASITRRQISTQRWSSINPLCLPRTCPSSSTRYVARRFYYDDPRIRNARPLLTTGQLGRVVRSPSTHTVIVLAVLGALIFYFSNLETVPVSGRTRFNCYSDEVVREVGESQAKKIMYQLNREGIMILPDYDHRYDSTVDEGARGAQDLDP
jgi:hypothetical protein